MSLRESSEATAAQLAANRSNAQHSTGPRTAEGKSRSRLNALRHGQWATGLCWSEESFRALGEDPEEFRQLVDGLKSAPGPAADPLWELQIEDLARLYWRRRRLERATETLYARPAQLNQRAALLTVTAPEGALLLKQLDAVDRSIDRKVRLLLRLRESEERQKNRLEAEARRRERAKAREKPGVLERLASGRRLNWEDLAEAEVELEEMTAETARLEEETRQMQTELAAMQQASELEERSQYVDENTAPAGRTATSDQ